MYREKLCRMFTSFNRFSYKLVASTCAATRIRNVFALFLPFYLYYIIIREGCRNYIKYKYRKENEIFTKRWEGKVIFYNFVPPTNSSNVSKEIEIRSDKNDFIIDTLEYIFLKVNKRLNDLSGISNIPFAHPSSPREKWNGSSNFLWWYSYCILITHFIARDKFFPFFLILLHGNFIGYRSFEYIDSKSIQINEKINKYEKFQD